MEKMILHVTYCSKKKAEGILPPDMLYKSERIRRFINKCKDRQVSWAILSAKYGFFFPEEKKKNYDTTFRSDKRYFLGIRVVEEGDKLPIEESKKYIEELRLLLLKQVEERQIQHIIFYAPNPRRAKCYLALLHWTFDGCCEIHRDKELISHIEESRRIKVIKSLDEIPPKTKTFP